MAGLLCATSAFSNAAEVSTFSSAADLNFEGTVLHALNLAGIGYADPITINGLLYLDPSYLDEDNGEVSTVPNVYYTNEGEFTIIANGEPNYGDTVNDDALESLMKNTMSPTQYGAVSFFGLTPGTTYNVYILAANNSLAPDQLSQYHLFDETFSINPPLDESDALNLTALQGGTMTKGVVIRLQGQAGLTGELLFSISTLHGAANPYVSGLVLTEVAPVATTVIIGTVDTGVPNFDVNGDTISDLIDGLEPEGGYKNHGQYVSAITALINDLVEAGTLTKEQGQTIHVIAAQSDIGKKTH